MTSSRSLFGTDGIRGTYGIHPICEEFGYLLGTAIVKYCAAHSAPIFTCIDSRQSGTSLEQALHQGIVQAGGKAISFGTAPTPALAYLVKHQPAAAGVVITASHNPHPDNGFKFFNSQGYKLSAYQEHQLAELICDLDAPFTPSPPSIASQLPTPYQDYLRLKLTQLAHTYSHHRPLKMIIDCAHGATSKLATQLFIHQNPLTNLSCHIIHNAPNGLNINHQVGATNTQSLSQAVLTEQADFGVGFDGDGDRLVIVDHHGQAVVGSALIAIIAAWLYQTTTATVPKAHSSIATTHLANSGLDHYLNRIHIQVQRTEVGDRALAQLMTTHRLHFGGEPSGHYLFSHHLATGDSLYTTIQILHLMLHQLQINPDFTWHQAAQNIPLLAETMTSIAIPQKIPLADLPTVKAAIQTRTHQLKQSSQHHQGRILWRYSGTEPKLRIMVEGAHQAQVDTIAHELATISLNEIKQQCSSHQ